MNWFISSNRYKHFLFAIPASLIFTMFFGFGLGFGMEFKDKQYTNNWDNLDLLATILGSIIGQLFQILIIYYLL